MRMISTSFHAKLFVCKFYSKAAKNIIIFQFFRDEQIRKFVNFAAGILINAT